MSIYRVSSGVFVSMLAAPLIIMGETHDVGLRLGMFFTILALGALAGPPISGAINQVTGGFKAVGYYAGTSLRYIYRFALTVLFRLGCHGFCRSSHHSATITTPSLMGQSLNALRLEYPTQSYHTRGLGLV